MSEQTIEMLTTQLRVLESKYRRAYRQAIIFDNKIADLKVRYYRALEVGRRSFLYTLRIQLGTLAAVRNMYSEYVSRTVDEAEAIQDQLVSLGVMSESEVDFDWDEE